MHQWIEKRLSQETTFGIETDSIGEANNEADPYTGYWKRIGDDDDSAEVEIVSLPLSFDGDERYFVTGIGFQNMSAPTGSTWGHFDFFSSMLFGMDGDRLEYKVGDKLRLRLMFTSDGHMKLTEATKKPLGFSPGAFAGVYQKTTDNEAE